MNKKYITVIILLLLVVFFFIFTIINVGNGILVRPL